ncbi:MAG: glutamate 5-kinase [Coriobacteriales bacterium]|jgi:glutamate 5-kinase|nr:glutamate 5-kinase [Coriobacteriales bacterium]
MEGSVGNSTKSTKGSEAARIRRVVVKIGTSTLTDDQGKLDLAYIEGLAAEMQELRAQGCELILVSSGAIAAGLEALGMSTERPEHLPILQAAAAVGQLELSQVYLRAFAKQGVRLAQVLLTRFEIENRTTYLHARDTLEKLLELGTVPLVNENDTVAVEEIRFGDNDTLAAQVAILIKADLAVILSDIEGLYTADPRIDEDAELLESVASFTKEIVDSAGEAGSSRGSGGMVTKLEAARMLMAANIPLVICEGRHPGAVADAVRGGRVGTRFARPTNGRQASARKLWLALSGSAKGIVFIDDGAALALRGAGGSLLSVGVRRVEGLFEAGQPVDIRTLDGFLIGRGISGYSTEELELAAEHNSSELSGDGRLAHLARTPVIHRDQMVIF